MASLPDRWRSRTTPEGASKVSDNIALLLSLYSGGLHLGSVHLFGASQFSHTPAEINAALRNMVDLRVIAIDDHNFVALTEEEEDIWNL